jgi:hypothetical protein
MAVPDFLCREITEPPTSFRPGGSLSFIPRSYPGYTEKAVSRKAAAQTKRSGSFEILLSEQKTAFLCDLAPLSENHLAVLRRI